MLGCVKVTEYTKTATGWRKTSERIELASILSASHWRKWQQFDGNGARLILNNGMLSSYTTKSPDGSQKVNYKLLRINYGGERFADVFDWFGSRCGGYHELTKTYERRARKCAEAAGIDFINESAFISSGKIHGFYLPNNRNGWRCVAFVAGNPVLLTNKDINEILDGKRGL